MDDLSGDLKRLADLEDPEKQTDPDISDRIWIEIVRQMIGIRGDMRELVTFALKNLG